MKWEWKRNMKMEREEFGRRSELEDERREILGSTLVLGGGRRSLRRKQGERKSVREKEKESVGE
jgi:hypothetical protein